MLLLSNEAYKYSGGELEECTEAVASQLKATSFSGVRQQTCDGATAAHVLHAFKVALYAEIPLSIFEPKLKEVTGSEDLVVKVGPDGSTVYEIDYKGDKVLSAQ